FAKRLFLERTEVGELYYRPSSYVVSNPFSLVKNGSLTFCGGHFCAGASSGNEAGAVGCEGAGDAGIDEAQRGAGALFSGGADRAGAEPQGARDHG
ncbi:hypothetical protein N9898_02890, partial [Akkermansiaceae bacterium]|nr:hypothetical protein [Akkermansiaceae bacterium]